MIKKYLATELEKYDELIFTQKEPEDHVQFSLKLKPLTLVLFSPEE